MSVSGEHNAGLDRHHRWCSGLSRLRLCLSAWCEKKNHLSASRFWRTNKNSRSVKSEWIFLKLRWSWEFFSYFKPTCRIWNNEQYWFWTPHLGSDDRKLPKEFFDKTPRSERHNGQLLLTCFSPFELTFTGGWLYGNPPASCAGSKLITLPARASSCLASKGEDPSPGKIPRDGTARVDVCGNCFEHHKDCLRHSIFSLISGLTRGWALETINTRDCVCFQHVAVVHLRIRRQSSMKNSI